MKSINRVVEKYNGTHAESYDYIKKEFNISVLLIIKQRTELIISFSVFPIPDAICAIEHTVITMNIQFA